MMSTVQEPAFEEGWHQATATCRNTSCKSNGVPIAVAVPDNPEEWGWGGVTCGACGQHIDDVAET